MKVTCELHVFLDVQDYILSIWIAVVLKVYALQFSRSKNKENVFLIHVPVKHIKLTILRNYSETIRENGRRR